MKILSPLSMLVLCTTGFASSQIHPVIVENCTKCHGGVKQKGGLDLRTITAALEGGETDTALIPGDPEASPLYQVVQVDSDPHMPPKKQLPAEEIKALKTWITDLKITPPKKLVLPDYRKQPATVIDQLIRAKWQANKIAPSRRSSDTTFVRRVYLDLLGRIPRPPEINSFLADQNPKKRNLLVDHLTNTNDHANHLAQVFNIVFLDRAHLRKRSHGNRKLWLDYLHWAFKTNRPWDQIGRDLVLARPASDQERGASWFIHDQRDDHSQIATRVSRTLLGKQVQCAQCHDHPVAPEIEQRHYWGLVAFFNRSLNVKTPKGPRVAERASGGYDKFANLEGKADQSQLILYSNKIITETGGKKTNDSAELYSVSPPKQWFRKLKKDEKLKKDLPNLPIPKFSRREAFAQSLTGENPDFSRAIVNRIWALMFGRGLVHPVDLMDSAHPSSHPELLAWLARDFSNNQYDLRRLIRQIAKSSSYQLDSRPAPSAGQPPLDSFFARALDKPLSAETFTRSLRVALGHEDPDDEALRSHIATILPDLFAENFSPSVQQTMFLTNAPLFDKIISESPLLSRLQNIENPQSLIYEIFQSVLSREPESSELERSLSFVKPKNKSSIQQFVWALLTSAEFRFAN